jgi:TRAP-type C4-dicarboxylate transport system permease small subunit
VLQAVRRASRWLAILGLAALLVLSVLMIADISGRELFGRPISGFSDATDLIIIVAAAACFPASLANRQHIAVRFAGMLHWRLREGLDLLGHLFMLLVFVVIAWQLGLYTLDVFSSGQTTWLLRVPVWPVWGTATVLLAVCVPVQLAQVVAILRRFLSPQPLDDAAADSSPPAVEA